MLTRDGGFGAADIRPASGTVKVILWQVELFLNRRRGFAYEKAVYMVPIRQHF
jgi:hypothetical protein